MHEDATAASGSPYPQLPRLVLQGTAIRARAHSPRSDLEKTFRDLSKSIGLTEFGLAYTTDLVSLKWMFFVLYPTRTTRSREPVLPIAIGLREKEGVVYIGSKYEVPLRAPVRAPFGLKPGSQLYQQLEGLRAPGMQMDPVSVGRRVAWVNIAFNVPPHLIPNGPVLKSYLDKLYDTAVGFKLLFDSKEVGY